MVDGIHVLDQLQNLVGVADLVVVPRNDLHEGVGQSDTGIGIEDGGTGVTQEVDIFIILFLTNYVNCFLPFFTSKKRP